MKRLMFIAALAASTAALAQTTSDPNAGGNMEQMGTQGAADTGAAAGQATTADPAATGTTGATGAQSGTMTDQQSMGSAGAATGQGTMSPGGAMSGGMTMAPGNNNPERDARGIPVVSDPAVAPPGTNMTSPGASMAAGGQGAAFTTQAASKEYPVCSRTVTDGCVQAYEGGRTRRRR